MTAKPGFSLRLRAAMRARGLFSAADLARSTHLEEREAVDLLATNIGRNVKATTIFALVDATKFSGRWLLCRDEPPTMRQPLSPDEAWLLESWRRLPPADAERIGNAIKRALLRA